MITQTQITVAYQGKTYSIKLEHELPDEILSGLKPEDSELLIRSAAGTAARASEDVFLDQIKGRVVNAMFEGENDTLHRIYKDLRTPDISLKEKK